MYEYGRGQCISLEGASIRVWKGPVYDYAGDQCMTEYRGGQYTSNLEGASI